MLKLDLALGLQAWDEWLGLGFNPNPEPNPNPDPDPNPDPNPNPNPNPNLQAWEDAHRLAWEARHARLRAMRHLSAARQAA